MPLDEAPSAEDRRDIHGATWAIGVFGSIFGLGCLANIGIVSLVLITFQARHVPLAVTNVTVIALPAAILIAAVVFGIRVGPRIGSALERLISRSPLLVRYLGIRGREGGLAADVFVANATVDEAEAVYRRLRDRPQAQPPPEMPGGDDPPRVH